MLGIRNPKFSSIYLPYTCTVRATERDRESNVSRHVVFRSYGVAVVQEVEQTSIKPKVGRSFPCSHSLHVEISLGKILNPRTELPETLTSVCELV